MDVNIITKEKMDAMKDLAQTNIKVSEARNLLFKLQEDETSYLEMREKKVMNRINFTIEESRKVIEETKSNWTEIKSLYTVASDMVSTLNKLSLSLTESVTDFIEMNEQWERDIGKQQDDLEEIRRELKIENSVIENDKKDIKRHRKLIEEEKTLIESRQAQIKSALRELEIKDK